MKLSLIDNALDSLHWSLKHFNNFLKKDPYFENKDKSVSDLKQAIINLNSCIELLLKKLISDNNEVLIYDIEKSNTDILQFYKARLKNLTQLPMYDYFVETKPEIRTITYSKCIDYFCEIYDVGTAYSKGLKHLNELRNSIMHLGVDYKQQYYILVEYVDKTLWFIQNELLPKLGYDEKVLIKIQGSIMPIESTFANIGNDLWKQLYKSQIDTIANKLEEIFNDSVVQSCLSNSERTIEFYATNDMEYSSARMTVKEPHILEEEIFSAYHDPLTRSLIISDGQQNATVFAVISLNAHGEIPSKFYLSKNPDGVIIERIDHQSEFWSQLKYSNAFHYIDYNKNSLTTLIKNMVMYCYSIEFVEAE